MTKIALVSSLSFKPVGPFLLPVALEIEVPLAVTPLTARLRNLLPSLYCLDLSSSALRAVMFECAAAALFLVSGVNK